MVLNLLKRFLLLRKKIREDLFFLAYLLHYIKLVSLSTNYHELGLYHRRSNEFTLLEFPRGTFKTTTYTVVETIQDVLIDRDTRILIGHFAGANARDMLSEISTHLETNEPIRFLFPEIVPQNINRPESGNWKQDSITVNRSLNARHLKEGSIEALGSDQAQASKHFDKIKFDDITVEASSTTVDQIKKANNFLTRSYSLLNNHSTRSLSIVGTEWVPDDTMVQVKKGKLLAPDGKPFKVFRIPAEMTKTETNERVALFPEILPLEVLDGLRASQRLTYHAFYLLDAEEFEDAAWSKNNIQWYENLDPARTYRIYGAVDPALTTTDLKNGCDTAMAIIAKDNLNELWVLDYQLGKGVDVIYEWFFSMHKKWKAVHAVVKKEDGTLKETKQLGVFKFFSLEATLFQELIAKQLRKLMQEKNTWIPLRESRPKKEKTARIMGALDPLITNKGFHAKIGMSELETQVIRFGIPGQKVDLLDSIAQAELESNTVVKSERKKKIDEEYNEMLRNAHIV